MKNLNDPWIRDRVFYTLRWVKRARDAEEFEERLPSITTIKGFITQTGIKDIRKATMVTSYLKSAFCGDWKGIILSVYKLQ